MTHVVLVAGKVVYLGNIEKAYEMYEMHKQGHQPCSLLRIVETNDV